MDCIFVILDFITCFSSHIVKLMLGEGRAGYNVIILFLGNVTKFVDFTHSFLILTQFIVAAYKHENRLLFQVWIFGIAHAFQLFDNLIKVAAILHVLALDQKRQRERRRFLLLHLDSKTFLILHLFLNKEFIDVEGVVFGHGLCRIIWCLIWHWPLDLLRQNYLTLDFDVILKDIKRFLIIHKTLWLFIGGNGLSRAKTW